MIFSVTHELASNYILYCYIQASWILEKQLDLISNRSVLWTDYGLRSLAKTRSIIYVLFMILIPDTLLINDHIFYLFWVN